MPHKAELHGSHSCLETGQIKPHICNNSVPTRYNTAKRRQLLCEAGTLTGLKWSPPTIPHIALSVGCDIMNGSLTPGSYTFVLPFGNGMPLSELNMTRVSSSTPADDNSFSIKPTPAIIINLLRYMYTQVWTSLRPSG